MTEARIGNLTVEVDVARASGRAAAETPAAADVFRKFRRVLNGIIALKSGLSEARSRNRKPKNF
jgi:hypothetical protein